VAGARRLADEIRTGLDKEEGMNTAAVPANLESSKKAAVDPLDEKWMGKTVRRHVREFGVIFGVLCGVIAAVKGYKGASANTIGMWSAVGIAILATGFVAPNVLRPFWRAWMKFAHYLSIVMTFLLLSIVWSIGFVPMAFVMRVFGVKPMDLSYRSGAPTYWNKRDTKKDDFKRLEQQY
jgi:hypothetical protein